MTKRRDSVDYSQWTGGSRLSRLVANTFNRLPGQSRLLATTNAEFPSGLAAFHFAAWDAYRDGDWEWASRGSGDESGYQQWIAYVTFLDQGWYEDGILAWKTAKWREDPVFVASYEAAVRQTGADYRISWRTHVALWAAGLALRVPGTYVEVGTGRGWMMSAILEGVLQHHPQRAVVLMDSFESARVDPTTGDRTDFDSPVYASGVEDVAGLSGKYPQVNVVVGDVFETAPLVGATHDSIAFVHFDLNAAAPEVFAFGALRARFSPGTVLLLDDYGFIGFEEQRDAWDLVAREHGLVILSLPTGQGLIVV